MGLLASLAVFAKKLWFLIFVPFMYPWIKIKEYWGRRKAEIKATNNIVDQMRRQIQEAFDENQELVTMRIGTYFTTGYLFCFITVGFSHQGMDGERSFEEYWKKILNDVLPNKLVEIFNGNLDGLEGAKRAGDEHPVKLFETGGEAGIYDSMALDVMSEREATNLKRYLVDDELVYVPISGIQEE